MDSCRPVTNKTIAYCRQVLGGGFQLVTLGGLQYVQSVPQELNRDGNVVLVAAQVLRATLKACASFSTTPKRLFECVNSSRSWSALARCVAETIRTLDPSVLHSACFQEALCLLYEDRLLWLHSRLPVLMCMQQQAFGR